jgi:hypothetical protein
MEIRITSFRGNNNQAFNLVDVKKRKDQKESAKRTRI